MAPSKLATRTLVFGGDESRCVMGACTSDEGESQERQPTRARPWASQELRPFNWLLSRGGGAFACTEWCCVGKTLQQAAGVGSTALQAVAVCRTILVEAYICSRVDLIKSGQYPTLCGPLCPDRCPGGCLPWPYPLDLDVSPGMTIAERGHTMVLRGRESMIGIYRQSVELNSAVPFAGLRASWLVCCTKQTSFPYPPAYACSGLGVPPAHSRTSFVLRPG